jgi:hypothetical protein
VIEPESLDVTVPPAAVDATVKVEETEGKAEVADAADAVPADFLTQVRQSMTDLGDVVFGRILLDRWPMLRRFAADAVVLLPNRPAEEGQNLEEQAVQLLLETHARALCEKERDAYVVLAAESLGSDDHPGVMAFIICPPGTDLPLLAPGQQAAKDPAFVLKAVEALCERPEISAFLFVESGNKKHEALSKRKGPFCRSAELLANWVAHRAKEPVVKVDLYVLATRGAAPGATLAAKAFGQLRNHIPAFKAPGARLFEPLHVEYAIGTPAANADGARKYAGAAVRFLCARRFARADSPFRKAKYRVFTGRLPIEQSLYGGDRIDAGAGDRAGDRDAEQRRMGDHLRGMPRFSAAGFGLFPGDRHAGRQGGCAACAA